VPDPATPRTGWGSCPFCGVAVEPGAKKCGICGAADPIPSGQLRSASMPVRRRIQMTSALRALIVVAVCGGLAYSIISTVVTGPPVVADPLTTTGSYAIGPGNFTLIWGEITGGDFVVGNFTTVMPPGTTLDVAIYNSTLWDQFLNGQDPAPLWTNTPGPTGQIVYSAPYTDNFYFVFTNPYAPTTHINITAYIVTQYESNVGDDGSV
jgi:hypothetical protein